MLTVLRTSPHMSRAQFQLEREGCCSLDGLPKLGKVLANQDMVIRSFRKCGISLLIDGILDTEINLEGIPDYKVDGEGSSELVDEDDMEADVEDGDDPFADV